MFTELRMGKCYQRIRKTIEEKKSLHCGIPINPSFQFESEINLYKNSVKVGEMNNERQFTAVLSESLWLFGL